tara:strand:+ start:12592 stop:13188 length:597 start_codon:yes stop_codon:yes gene_type:complete
MGNLHSVSQAFKRLDQSIKLIKRPNELNGCKALILPGVGAFDPAIKNLEKTELIPYIKKWVKNGNPLLGICLGLQLLFESSDEGHLKGLSLLKGTVKHLPKDQAERVPHMGWSLLEEEEEICPLFIKNQPPSWMYFVHSYSAIPKEKNNLAASVKYGNNKVTAVVWEDNFGACQFHPEKSGKAGERLLFNWVKWLDNQ